MLQHAMRTFIRLLEQGATRCEHVQRPSRCRECKDQEIKLLCRLAVQQEAQICALHAFIEIIADAEIPGLSERAATMLEISRRQSC